MRCSAAAGLAGWGAMMLRALLLLPATHAPAADLAARMNPAATHAPAADLAARLNPPASTGPCTVLEIERDSVPAATTWFRLRSASSGKPMPAQMMGTDAGGEGLWFARTAPKAGDAGPKGIQQFPFQSTGEFNAGNVAQIVPANLSAEATAQSFIVEAWSDRNDLGDGAAAKLLASSAPMAFAFDDAGFSKALGFDDFAVESPAAVPGMLTVTAQPTNATAMKMAKLVTWYGFQPPTAGAAAAATAAAGALPTFTLDTALAGYQYTTREFPTPTANFSFSSPGVWFVGICTRTTSLVLPPLCPPTRGSLTLPRCWSRQTGRGTGSTVSPSQSRRTACARTTPSRSTTPRAPPSSRSHSSSRGKTAQRRPCRKGSRGRRTSPSPSRETGGSRCA